MKLCLLVLSSFFGTILFAQDSTDLIVHADPRVEMLVKKQSDINLAVKKANARTARGYRVLVINTNKRDEAMAAKTKIYSNFPELKAYLVYQSPFFKLKLTFLTLLPRLRFFTSRTRSWLGFSGTSGAAS